MSRRASLPGAAELFRATSAGEPEPASAHPGVGAVREAPAVSAVPDAAAEAPRRETARSEPAP
ncbi:MAG: hypothetical protein JWQ77_3655, partial [Jatrophihabitans sp.]|nr:hypothetical protein [Jatrophihabitans sp.]